MTTPALDPMTHWTTTSGLAPGNAVRRVYEPDLRTVRRVRSRGAYVVVTFTDGTVEESDASFVWTFVPAVTA